ncbi:zinc metalloprotease HtpX [uncultured Desulfuromusa sp.]|uniref:zinc metalloprotease HtpX n=1 Tax=uncultured Desulfuromusa sp. TaxID=219183 RepID=UPI00374893E2
MFRRSPINQLQWLRHRWQNRLQTVFLLGFLGCYTVLLGWLIWGSSALIWLLAITVVLFLLVPVGSPNLLMKLYGGQPLTRTQAPQLYRQLEQLAHRAELENSPSLYYLPMLQPNAMAVGTREESSIAISEGLLRILNERELAGVVAHEISHLRNDDIKVMRLADLISRLSSSLSLFGQILLLMNLPLLLFTDLNVNWLLVLVLIFAPQVSILAQLRLSRVREFNADLSAATLTGDPEGLAMALQKIERQANSFSRRVFSFSSVPDWLKTHPSTRERICRLMKLRGEEWQVPLWRVPLVYRPMPITKPVRVFSLNRYPRRQGRVIYRS